jgi:cell volume regulation protein A
MTDVAFAFAALGAIILIGFFSALAFEKTKVPDVIVLIIIGLIFGPIALTFFNVEFISKGALDLIAPYFTSLALVIILFDGGLNMNFAKVLSGIWRTVFYAFTGFALSMLVVTAVAYFLFGFPIMIAVLLGAILGGVSSAVVFELLRKMSIKEETRSLLSLESVISDVLCVVVVLSVIVVLRGEGTGVTVVATLAKSFSIAIVGGLVFGIVWLRLLSVLKGKPFSFMITIAALLLLYSGIELVEGSGLVAALVFGLVLGNKDEVIRMFRIKSELVFDERIKSFHSEVSFLIRAIFFVFLGLSFTLNVQDIGIVSPVPFFSGYYGLILLLMIGLVLITIGIMLTRYINMKITVFLNKDLEVDRGVLSYVSARGLTAAALAALPFTIAEFVGPPSATSYYVFMAPYRTGLLNITFLVILITVAITSIGIYLTERRRKGKTLEQVEKEDEILLHEREVLKKWKNEEKEKRKRKIIREREKRKKHQTVKKNEKMLQDEETDALKERIAPSN